MLILFVFVLSMPLPGCTTEVEGFYQGKKEVLLEPQNVELDESVPEELLSPYPYHPYGLPWDQARYHIGERATVYGPVESTKWATQSRGQPTFLNLGNPYPDPNRFTVVIWVENRKNFPFPPEVYYQGRPYRSPG
ncbi:MAG: hypothetical protein ACUVS1_08955 [Actinomycetota bacterium]